MTKTIRRKCSLCNRIFEVPNWKEDYGINIENKGGPIPVCPECLNKLGSDDEDYKRKHWDWDN